MKIQVEDNHFTVTLDTKDDKDYNLEEYFELCGQVALGLGYSPELIEKFLNQ